MSEAKPSGYGCFDRLIAALQVHGNITEAQRLHTMLHEVAWTTSSELLGELGREIVAIQSGNPVSSVDLHRALEDCLAVVRRVWPSIGR